MNKMPFTARQKAKCVLRFAKLESVTSVQRRFRKTPNYKSIMLWYRTFEETGFKMPHTCGRGPIMWPPNSLDLTPPDIFLWGFLKNDVYSQRPMDIDDLKEKICRAFQKVTPAAVEVDQLSGLQILQTSPHPTFFFGVL